MQAAPSTASRVDAVTDISRIVESANRWAGVGIPMQAMITANARVKALAMERPVEGESKGFAMLLFGMS